MTKNSLLILVAATLAAVASLVLMSPRPLALAHTSERMTRLAVREPWSLSEAFARCFRRMGWRPTILLLLLTILFSAGCGRITFPSSAMEPTIKAGERVTIDFAAYALSRPRRWDVIAFEPPRSTNILVMKRVIALRGETISMTASGIVVNATILAMPASLSNVTYCPPERLSLQQRTRLVSFPYNVPAQHYFVVGDNWTNSYDSRDYGAVPARSIAGKVQNK